MNFRWGVSAAIAVVLGLALPTTALAAVEPAPPPVVVPDPPPEPPVEPPVVAPPPPPAVPVIESPPLAPTEPSFPGGVFVPPAGSGEPVYDEFDPIANQQRIAAYQAAWGQWIMANGRLLPKTTGGVHFDLTPTYHPDGTVSLAFAGFGTMVNGRFVLTEGSSLAEYHREYEAATGQRLGGLPPIGAGTSFVTPPTSALTVSLANPSSSPARVTVHWESGDQRVSATELIDARESWDGVITLPATQDLDGRHRVTVTTGQPMTGVFGGRSSDVSARVSMSTSPTLPLPLVVEPPAAPAHG